MLASAAPLSQAADRRLAGQEHRDTPGPHAGPQRLHPGSLLNPLSTGGNGTRSTVGSRFKFPHIKNVQSPASVSPLL